MNVVPLEQVGTPVPLWVPAFLTPLRLTYIDGREWACVGAFDFESAVLGEIVQVEDGDRSDFASTPRIGWWLFPPIGPYGKPAFVHDKLYRTKGLVTKAQADLVFMEAMTVLTPSVLGPFPADRQGMRGLLRRADYYRRQFNWWLTRQIMYHAVKWFGRSSYKGGL